jgi:hypothetical protein
MATLENTQGEIKGQADAKGRVFWKTHLPNKPGVSSLPFPPLCEYLPRITTATSESGVVHFHADPSFSLPQEQHCPQPLPPHSRLAIIPQGEALPGTSFGKISQHRGSPDREDTRLSSSASATCSAEMALQSTEETLQAHPSQDTHCGQGRWEPYYQAHPHRTQREQQR